MAIRIEEEYRCSPETLWRHLEDPELQKQWMKGLVANRATTPGPTRVGSTFEMDIKEGRKVSTYKGVMTVWEPIRRMALTLEGGCMGGAKMLVSYELEPLGGTTRLDYTCGVETKGKMMKIMFFLFGWFAKLQVKSFFRRLRKMVER